MPKKNSAPQPIGKGKAGTGKRMLYKEGAGKKALKTWRSMDQSFRKVVKKASAKSGHSLTSYVRGQRSATRKFKLPITKDSPKVVKK